MRTYVRLVKEGETVEWDCLHESGDANDDESQSDEDGSGDASMEDLTEENKKDGDGTHSDGSSSEEEDNKEKAENNSCISIYYQSKRHDVEVNLTITHYFRQQLACNCLSRCSTISSTTNSGTKSRPATTWLQPADRHEAFTVSSLSLRVRSSTQ